MILLLSCFTLPRENRIWVTVFSLSEETKQKLKGSVFTRFAVVYNNKVVFTRFAVEGFRVYKFRSCIL